MSFDLGTLVFDRTQADVDAKNAKGTYNYTDVNRVEKAADYIQGILNADGYTVSLVVQKEWRIKDIPRISDMARYLSNVKTLAGMIPYSFDPVGLPGTMEKLTYEGANAIEKTLYDVGKAAESIETNWLYSGMIESGVAYL